jgi:hypothetical protein
MECLSDMTSIWNEERNFESQMKQQLRSFDSMENRLNYVGGVDLLKLFFVGGGGVSNWFLYIYNSSIYLHAAGERETFNIV